MQFEKTNRFPAAVAAEEEAAVALLLPHHRSLRLSL